MIVIKIEADNNGSHNNHEYHGKLLEGWAMCPLKREVMPNFPFGTPTVEEINGVMTVTAWQPGVMPEPEPMPDPEPTEAERLRADIDYIAIMTGVEL